MIVEIILALAVLYILFSYLMPYWKLKTIRQECINQDDYCMIDVRDYHFAYRNPYTVGTKNIPLSYLSRASREEEVCDKDIVVIAESRLAAVMAARILKRRTKRFIYYVTMT